MNKDRRTVALLFGGVGREREVSISAAPYIYSLIDKSKYKVIPLLIDGNGEFYSASWSSDGSLSVDSAPSHLYRMYGAGGVIIGGDFFPVDAAFPLLHGDRGEDGVIQGALDALSIPFVGCDGYSGSLAMDKVYTKIIASHLGVPIARYLSAKIKLQTDRGTKTREPDEILRLAESAESAVGYPMIIKPSRLGSSFGVSKAQSKEELISGISQAAECGDGRVLIEECVDVAIEAEVGYYSARGVTIITRPGGVVCRGVYDHSLKYEDTAGVALYDELPLCGKISALIADYSDRLCDFLGLRHLSRIDFFITRDDRVVFNEINTMPGFTSSSLYPRLLMRAGISPSSAVNAFIEDAISR